MESIYARRCIDMAYRNQPMLGGKDVILQIDESVIAKQKYHRGHLPAGAQKWVFGIYDTAKKITYMELVQDRSAATLLPIIQKYCLQGSIIYSDKWKAYQSLASLGYVHRTVNHSKEFTGPDGTTTNNIECQWNSAKRKFKMMVGTSEGNIVSYLDEWMWRQYHGKKS